MSLMNTTDKLVIAIRGIGHVPAFKNKKDNMRKTPSNSPKSAAMDGVGYEGYALSVEVLVSDRRRRDLDGALATICDCIVAVGRQLAADTADPSESEDGKKRVTKEPSLRLRKFLPALELT